MNTQWDLILAGGGLANGLIALRLRVRQPRLNVLLLEASDAPGGNHTWSFHGADLTAEQHAWLTPLVAHRWDGYEVRFPALTRTLDGGYYSVTSERFAHVLQETVGERLWRNAPVASLTSQSVTLTDGRTLYARAVIDGRGWQASSHLTAGQQAFLGQQWRLAAPHGLTRPVLMDATVAQQGGYRFVYTLPLTPDTLLIEDTHYIDSATLDHDRARENIASYARSQGWQLATLEREERGNLPITLTGAPQAFWREAQGVARGPARRAVPRDDRLFAAARGNACRSYRRAAACVISGALCADGRLRAAPVAASALFPAAEPDAVSGRKTGPTLAGDAALLWTECGAYRPVLRRTTDPNGYGATADRQTPGSGGRSHAGRAKANSPAASFSS